MNGYIKVVSNQLISLASREYLCCLVGEGMKIMSVSNQLISLASRELGIR